MAKIRVAIIGAGAAGLSMCKCLTNEPLVQFVVFEKSDKIGGDWQYTKDKPEDKYHTAMYKNLRTNLPKEVMAFPGFPFPKGLPSYVDREIIKTYLEAYADHFDLRKNIQLEHEVILVKPYESEHHLTWQVVAKDAKNGGTEVAGVFDAVVVCNGHYSNPRIPDIPGLDDFPGTVMHSLLYSEPEMFKDKTVVILGARTSGIDLCMEISDVAKKVYLVHRKEKLPVDFAENVEEIIGTLTHAFVDGSVEINHEYRKAVDCVIFCTGYNYAFPFLAPECKIEVTNNRVTSLYQHVFNTAYPTLSFVGICQLLLPFPIFDLQSQWITEVLTGRKKLPSRQDMVKDEKMDYRERLNAGVAPRDMHSLGVERQEKYGRHVAKLAEVPELSPVYFSLYNRNSRCRAANAITYRNTNYSLNGDEWFIVGK